MPPDPEQLNRVVRIIEGHRTILNRSRQAMAARHEALFGGFRIAVATWEAKQAAVADDFNLLEASGIADNELVHSRILAWLLDRRLSRGTHAQGRLGFRLFLEELGPALGADVSYAEEPFWVTREVVGDESRVDIEIAARTKFVIHIENKIWSSEGDDQTNREWKDLERRADELGVSRKRTHGVFLTLNGSQPANKNFVAVGWHQIVPVLEQFAAQGDNVDAGYVDQQFKNSVRFMDKLNGVVPYGVACGNHDGKDAKKGSYTSTKFVDYYGPERFENCSWYGGASPSGFSSFQTFTGGGIKFLALELTVAAPKEEVEWAKKVMAEHSSLPVILTTHQMLTPGAKMGKGTAASGPGRQTPSQVWEQLIEPSPQIFMVLCGHYNGEAYAAKETQAAQPVHVVLQDYQNEPHGGDGWLRIFTFHPDENKVGVQTYSPTLKQYKTEPSTQFSFDVDFKRLAGHK